MPITNGHTDPAATSAAAINRFYQRLVELRADLDQLLSDSTPRYQVLGFGFGGSLLRLRRQWGSDVAIVGFVDRYNRAPWYLRWLYWLTRPMRQLQAITALVKFAGLLQSLEKLMAAEQNQPESVLLLSFSLYHALIVSAQACWQQRNALSAQSQADLNTLLTRGKMIMPHPKDLFHEDIAAVVELAQLSPAERGGFLRGVGATAGLPHGSSIDTGNDVELHALVLRRESRGASSELSIRQPTCRNERPMLLRLKQLGAARLDQLRAQWQQPVFRQRVLTGGVLVVAGGSSLYFAAPLLASLSVAEVPFVVLRVLASATGVTLGAAALRRFNWRQAARGVSDGCQSTEVGARSAMVMHRSADLELELSELLLRLTHPSAFDPVTSEHSINVECLQLNGVRSSSEPQQNPVLHPLAVLGVANTTWPIDTNMVNTAYRRRLLLLHSDRTNLFGSSATDKREAQQKLQTYLTQRLLEAKLYIDLTVKQRRLVSWSRHELDVSYVEALLALDNAEGELLQWLCGRYGCCDRDELMQLASQQSSPSLSVFAEVVESTEADYLDELLTTTAINQEMIDDLSARLASGELITKAEVRRHVEQAASGLTTKTDELQDELNKEKGRGDRLQAQLGETQTQLGETQTQLEETQTQLGETQTQLGKQKERGDRLEDTLNRVLSHLGMESKVEQPSRAEGVAADAGTHHPGPADLFSRRGASGGAASESPGASGGTPRPVGSSST